MAIKEILSPLPGTFYRRPAPDKPFYKEAGDAVAAGDALGLVEVMKTFYEVKAEDAGKLIRFLVENEDAVQAGQLLAEIEV
jgi:acetyl-CoA carboxylase biotin carboxyl carrier protein